MQMIKQKKIQGFSLVEICIVCGVLAVLMLPVFAMMSKGSAVTIRNRNEILAQQHALNVISYCNIVPYDDPFLNVTEGEDGKPVGELTIKFSEDTVIDMNMTEEGFKKIATRTVSIKEFNPGDGWPNKYKIVTVKVEWQQVGEPNTRKVCMSGLISGNL